MSDLSSCPRSGSSALSQLLTFPQLFSSSGAVTCFPLMMIYRDLAHAAGRGKTVLKVRFGGKVQMNCPQFSPPRNDNAVLLPQGAGMWGRWIPQEVLGGQRGCEVFRVNLLQNVGWYFRSFLPLTTYLLIQQWLWKDTWKRKKLQNMCSKQVAWRHLVFCFFQKAQNLGFLLVEAEW